MCDILVDYIVFISYWLLDDVIVKFEEFSKIEVDLF